MCSERTHSIGDAAYARPGPVCATVIVASGRESEERLSQAAAAETVELISVDKISAEITPGSFMGPLNIEQTIQRNFCSTHEMSPFESISCRWGTSGFSYWNRYWNRY